MKSASAEDERLNGAAGSRRSLAASRPLHILEMSGNAIVGGMETYVLNLAAHLPEHQLKVTVLAPYESVFTADLRRLGSEVFVTSMGDDPAWRSIQFTTELIRSLKVDLVHAHLPRAHMLAGLAGRLANVPVVATVHGMEVNLQDLGIHRTTGTHLTVVCQQALVHALSLGVPEDRLTLIPNGVDVQRFSPGRSGQAFRQQYGIPAEARLVGYVGRIAWEKGPDHFVNMAAHIHKRRPDIHFVMVGDGLLRGEMEALVQELGLGAVFHFTGVFADTAQVYPALNLLAQTSRVEGMPLTLLEGMACGLPVAAMGVGGVPEILDAGLSGRLAAGGDFNGLGDAVLDILDNLSLADGMGQHARQRVEQGFDLTDTVRRMAGLFHRLLHRTEKSLPGWTSPALPVTETLAAPPASG